MNDEPQFLQGRTPYFIIGLTVLALYFQTLFFGFTGFDDNLLILQNSYWLRQLTNVWQVFSRDAFMALGSTPATYFFYRPLMILSFMFDAQWGALSAASLHFTNLTIHFTAAALLFIFLQKLRYKRELAFLGALVFAVHPAIASAITWIPGRNDSLLAVFVLASFICFIDYLEKEKPRDAVLSVAFFFLALLTKEVALVLIGGFLYCRQFIVNKNSDFQQTVLLVLGWVTASSGWHLLRQGAMSQKLTPGLFSMLQALAVNWPSAVQSLGKIIFPFNLAVAPIIRDTMMLYGYLAIIVLSFLLILTKSRRSNFILFGLLWFLLFLLPTQLIVSIFQLEHRLYLPLIGIIIVLLETGPVKKIELNSRTGFGTALFLCLLIAINITHSRLYSDPLTFWRAAARSSPHSANAHFNLGLVYAGRNMPAAEEAEYDQAFRLNPAEPGLHNSRGMLFMRKKMWREAEREFNQELAVNKENDVALLNLGVLGANVGQLKLAEQYWLRAVAVNPENRDAYLKLAIYYYQIGDNDRSDQYVKILDQKGIRVTQKIRVRRDLNSR